MLYDLCRPVVRVKRPDCSYHTVHTGLNDPTFMSIFIRRSLEGVMIYTTSPPYSRTGCNFSFQCNKLKKSSFSNKKEIVTYSSFNRASFVTFVTAKVTI